MAAAKDRVASRRSRMLTFRSIDTTPSRSVVNGGRIRKEWDSKYINAYGQPRGPRRGERKGEGARKSGIRKSVVRYSWGGRVSATSSHARWRGEERQYVDDGIQDDERIQPGPVQAGDTDAAVDHIGGPADTRQKAQLASGAKASTYDLKK